MILKNITLENIRSYKNKTVIDFPYGRTLFQGDIGSGKSTILSAVEFALFGLGDIDANHLLRVGATTGSVFLEFESNKAALQSIPVTFGVATKLFRMRAICMKMGQSLLIL